MIYVPRYSPTTFPCVVFQNATTIRAYRQMPAPGTTRQFYDFFFTAGARYMRNVGTQTFGTTATMPVCIQQQYLTSNPMHRTDLPEIMIIIVILIWFCILMPLKIFTRLFRRFKD